METHTAKGFIQKYATPLSILGAGIIIAVAVNGDPLSIPNIKVTDTSIFQESVLPDEGVVLPITWGDLGAKLVAVGAIDTAKLEALYGNRGGFPSEYQNMLEEHMDEPIAITNWNSGYLLNLFWALGLANKNPILDDTSEMMNPAYGGAGNFASTGGWILSKGNAMEHYNTHELIVLTETQQALVDRVSQGIFRPCCGNSTHFPDCNHGMAMLGLLELMASQGVGEEEMYATALHVNSYWFPDTYLTIATYMQQKGIEWKDVSPREMLGADYSSGSGYANIASQVTRPQDARGGGGCST